MLKGARRHCATWTGAPRSARTPKRALIARLSPLPQGLVLIVLRAAAEKLLVPPLTAYLGRRPAPPGAKPAARRAHEAVDNAFLVSFIAPLSIWGWWVMLHHNGPCTPLEAKGCLVGWPDHPMTIEVRRPRPRAFEGRVAWGACDARRAAAKGARRQRGGTQHAPLLPGRNQAQPSAPSRAHPCPNRSSSGGG